MFRIALAPLLMTFFITLFSSVSACADGVDFTRDVRPILSDHCFACHGPDAAERKADLRLDTADGIALVINKNALHESELTRRVRSQDADELMPPGDFHKPLSQQQKRILTDWVHAGATFQQHWAFDPPKKPQVDDINQPIDSFLNRRIKAAGLNMTPRADARTLLRRVCLDLTGLPPTREQTEAFLADKEPDAYSRLIDRLQQSPHYGENMARYWLDLVRYGDTHGLHLDNYREMWPYRDWVINAFNDNMPFNQFIIEQLAGDLISDATDSQKIASGFNRLNVTTNEGGSIYDEVFARNVTDRTDSFGTIFLGLTTGCAVCHDHKFDPISQRDYYSLSAFFNSLDGRAMDENIKNPAPVLAVLTDEAKQKLQDVQAAQADLETQMAQPMPAVDAAQAAWESALVSGKQPKSVVLHPVEVISEENRTMTVRDDDSIELTESAAAKDTTTIIAELPSDAAWQSLHLQALVDKPDQRVGVSANGNVVLTEIAIDTATPDAPETWNPVPIRYALADISQDEAKFSIDYAIDEKLSGNEGWAVAGHQQTGPRNAWFVVPSLMLDSQTPGTRIRVKMMYRSNFAKHQFRRVQLSVSDSAPVVAKEQQVTFGPIHSIGPFPVESPAPGYGRTFASRGKPFKADKTFKYEDKPYQWKQRDDIGPVELVPLSTVTDRSSVVLLHQNIHAPRAQKVTLLLGSDDGHQIFLNGKKIGEVRGPATHKPLRYEYQVDLKKGDNRLYIQSINHSDDAELSYAWRSPTVGVPEQLVELVRRPAKDRTVAQKTSLQKYYRSVLCLHPEWLALMDHSKGLQTSREKIVAEAPTALVWKELNKPRAARILVRGQYDQPGEIVPRATPSFLPPMPGEAPADRMSLARWLCSDQNPLTARVAVNRFWQQFFGTGIVKTSEDFGSQGEPPSHPELLDHLSVDFRENGWDVNRLVKQLVMTDAYQRSSFADPDALRIDPDNRLLARGARYRLDAETIRDQALAFSGLLRKKVGGPSVKPPQPDGLWYAVGYSGSNTAKFTADTDDDKIYRRSVYTFWKRTSAPPQMATLDAPSRESCTARRERTNTPLQALLLMNEVQYLQAAKHLAQRVAEQTELDDDQSRIHWLFETVTIRPPSTDETTELQRLLGDLTQHYESDLDAAETLAGQRSADKAAWIVLTSALLNLDEVVSK